MIEIATLCREGTHDDLGRLTIARAGLQYCTSRIYPRPLDARFAIRYMRDLIEARREQALEVTVIDADGRPIHRWQFQMMTASEKLLAYFAGTNMRIGFGLVCDLSAFLIPAPGVYRIDVSIDQQVVEQLQFSARYLSSALFDEEGWI